VKLATYLNLVPRLRMRGDILSLHSYVFMASSLIKPWILVHGVVLS